jgi:hypothetical protein
MRGRGVGLPVPHRLRQHPSMARAPGPMHSSPGAPSPMPMWVLGIRPETSRAPKMAPTICTRDGQVQCKCVQTGALWLVVHQVCTRQCVHRVWLQTMRLPQADCGLNTALRTSRSQHHAKMPCDVACWSRSSLQRTPQHTRLATSARTHPHIYPLAGGPTQHAPGERCRGSCAGRGRNLQVDRRAETKQHVKIGLKRRVCQAWELQV